MIIFLTALLGSLMNRIRGGFINQLAWNRSTWLPEWTEYWAANHLPLDKYAPLGKRIGKYGTPIVFGLLAGALLGSWWAALVATVGMFVGASFGWGKYMGAIIFKTFDPEEEEVKWIDNLVMRSTDNARLRGVVAMGLRGFIWTACVALPLAYWDLNVLLLIPVGFLMGIPYLIDFKYLADTKYFEAEWFWGFILWGSFAAIII